MILNRAVFFGLIDFYGKLFYMPEKHEQGNQVGDCHKSVEGIGDVPKQSKVHGSTNDRNEGIYHEERADELFTAEELDAARAV